MTEAPIPGNRRVAARLRAIVAAGKLPGSLLFTGPEGVGKRDTALFLARLLNCVRPEEAPCFACPACRRIGRDEHPDVARLRPEGPGGQLKADAVRRVIQESPFRPFEGRARVYVFEEADRMNPSAANALLKTLEEPPPWTVLILITSREPEVLPTLLSRCQKVRFPPLGPDEVEEKLVLDHEIDREAARRIAAVAGGSVTRALELAAVDVGEIREQALGLAGLVARGATRLEIVSRADSLAKHPRLNEVLRVFLTLTRDLAARAAGADPSSPDAELAAALGSLSRKARLSSWLDAYSHAEQALYDLKIRYANKRITLENLFLRLDAATREC